MNALTEEQRVAVFDSLNEMHPGDLLGIAFAALKIYAAAIPKDAVPANAVQADAAARAFIDATEAIPEIP